MPTITFIGDPNHTSVSWETSTVWQGGVVPDSSTDDVVIPTIFHGGTTNIYASTINIASTSIDIGELFLANNTLEVGIGNGASLTVAGGAEVTRGGDLLVYSASFSAGAFFVMSGGELGVSDAVSFSTSSFQNSGYIEDGGSAIDVSGKMVNDAGALFVGGSSNDTDTSSITAGTFDNLGTLSAGDGALVISTSPGGIENLSGGVLSGGAYDAGAPGSRTSNGQIDLHGASVITTDSAQILLADQGDLDSYNTASSAFQTIQSTLQTIATAGSLTLFDTAYAWKALTVDGQLLVEGGTLTSPQLTVASGATLGSFGTVAGPVTDDGTIVVGLTSAETQPFENENLTPASATLEVTGAVTGTGVAVIEPSFENPLEGVFDPWALQFDAAASVNVSFLDGSGTLVLADPSQFTGSIAPATAGGDKVELTNVALSSMTSYSYVSDDGHGTLRLNFSSGPSISLKFTGDYLGTSFVFSNQQPLSSSPPTLVITVGHALQDDFLGQSLSDILLENAAGQVDIGQLSNGKMALTPVLSGLGSQWKFVGNGDFLGTSVDQTMIENTQGSIGVGPVSSGALHFSTVGALDPSWKFVGDGDFLGNGSSDFLVENASGQLDLGLIVGGKATETQIGTLGSQWKVVGAADFLGLGPDQIAIENTQGSVGIGTVTGGAVHFTAVGVLSSDEKIVGTGDFFGDLGNGNSQFLVENTATGALDFDEVVNGALTPDQEYKLGSQWSVVGTGDYLGDGSDHVLIENTAGALGVGEFANSVAGPHYVFSTVGTGFSEWMFH